MSPQSPQARVTESSAHSEDWSPALIQAVVTELKDTPGALLPILHRIQQQLGHIPEAAIPIIADGLQQTRADVYGVISFYHHFRTQPPGRHVLQVCRAEACQAMGSRKLENHIKSRLGLDYHQTGLDQEFTLEPVYCLGNCACAPSIRVNDRIHGRMTADKFDRLTDQLTTTVLEIQ